MTSEVSGAVLAELARLGDRMERRLDAMQSQSSKEHRETAKTIEAIDDRLKLVETRDETEERDRKRRVQICREMRTTVFGGIAAVAALVGLLAAAGVL